MRETAFIKKNKSNWIAFQKALRTGVYKPDDLAALFIKVNNDLSYARTYYPKSKLVAYLNALSATAHNQIYARETSLSSFGLFWIKEVPLLSYTYRNYFYFAFCSFFLFVSIGWLSSVYDMGFTESVLGEAYVNQTHKNALQGDPLGVYNNDSRFEDFDSFYAIAFNNIFVGLKAFVLGLFAGVGSLLVMMQNGVMVGAFQHMFWELDHFALSLRTIWMHGAMELFAMNIEIAAGILMGTSFIFPGKLSRKQSFRQKTKASVKLLISTFPFTILAALLEGYITQYANEMHWFFSSTIVLSTLLVISFYYLIYPFWVKKNMYDPTVEFSEFIQQID